MTSFSPNKDKLNSANKAGSELKEEFEKINNPKMRDKLIGSFHMWKMLTTLVRP